MELSSPPMMNDDMDTNHSDHSGNDLPASAVKMASQLDPSTIRQLQQLQQLLMRQTGDNNNSAVPGPSSSSGGGGAFDGMKFNTGNNKSTYNYGDNDNGDALDSAPSNKFSSHHGGQPPLPPSSSSASHQQQQQSMGGGGGVSSMLGGSNITDLLQDPNVLLQLQTLQKLNNANEMEEKQTKLVEMRLQEEAFEKHLAKVLTKLPFANECDLSRGQHVDLAQFAAAGGPVNIGMMNSGGNLNVDNSTLNNDPEVEFIGATNSKLEIINLDGNDSRSPTPDRDRYKRNRRNSRSRSRDRGRGGRNDRRRGSRSRSRSPRRRRNSSRDRGSRSDYHRSSRSEKATADKEREAYERDRRRKGLPDIRKEHLSVCSTTLWVGHLSKLVQQEELSDTFGKFGDIVSIDMIVPRGCAFIAMNRRQDAYRAMGDLKHHKMHGRVITISWATGKGVKSKEWKDYWEVDLGVSYIPWSKLSHATNFDALEEGGMFDEDSMPEWLKLHVKQPKTGGAGNSALDVAAAVAAAQMFDASHPPPLGGPGGGLAGMPLVPPFGLPPGAAARLLPPPMAIPMGLSLAVPPPMMIPTGATGGPPPPPQQPDFMQMFQMAAGMGGGPGPVGLKPPMHMNNSSNNGDNDMDIENDEEEEAAMAANAAGDPMAQIALQNFFNRPPPLMGGGGGGGGGPGLLGPGGLMDGMGGDMMGGRGGGRGGGDRHMGRNGGGRGGDQERFGGDRGRWSNNGRMEGGGREFNNSGGGGRRGNFNNNGDMFDRRDNGGGEAFDRRGEGEHLLLVLFFRPVVLKNVFCLLHLDFRDEFDRRGGGGGRDFHGGRFGGPRGGMGTPMRGGGGGGDRFNRRGGGGPRGELMKDN